jgi:hypothetical protein
MVDPIKGSVMEKDEVHVSKAHDLNEAFPKEIGLKCKGCRIDAVLLFIKAINARVFVFECIF